MLGGAWTHPPDLWRTRLDSQVMAALDIPNETVFTMETTPIKFGPGATDEVAYDLKRLGVRRPLLVTDPGLMRVGLPDRVCRLLREAGLDVTFSGASRRTAGGMARRWSRPCWQPASRSGWCAPGRVPIGASSASCTIGTAPGCAPSRSAPRSGSSGACSSACPWQVAERCRSPCRQGDDPSAVAVHAVAAYRRGLSNNDQQLAPRLVGVHRFFQPGQRTIPDLHRSECSPTDVLPGDLAIGEAAQVDQDRPAPIATVRVPRAIAQVPSEHSQDDAGHHVGCQVRALEQGAYPGDGSLPFLGSGSPMGHGSHWRGVVLG